jgi:hypothetical protein
VLIRHGFTTEREGADVNCALANAREQEHCGPEVNGGT